jgi:hypothetical protein
MKNKHYSILISIVRRRTIEMKNASYSNHISIFRRRTIEMKTKTNPITSQSSVGGRLR